jgi:predicted nucleic acid-binding protein
LSFVLDSSLSLAWCFEDEQTPAVMALLDRIIETGASAPLLWPLEVLNALFAAERRRRIDGPRRQRLAAFLRDLPVTLDGETAVQAWEATTRLAERFRLTTYDAAYLELAHRRRLPLTSLDRELRVPASTIGVETLGLSA